MRTVIVPILIVLSTILSACGGGDPINPAESHLSTEQKEHISMCSSTHPIPIECMRPDSCYAQKMAGYTDCTF